MRLAYHRALLLHHPDKQVLVSRDISTRERPRLAVALLKEAFETLSTPDLRAKYDAIRTRHPSGPRPAQVLSLADFTELEEGIWHHDCRCSGSYTIMEAEMERGQHLVGCGSCSEVIWVGYELVEDVEEGGLGATRS